METETKKFRIMFMGTPAFAADVLQQLLQWEQGEICCCVTQPDRPAKRGRKLLASPVKELACAHNIVVLQPETLRNEAVQEELSQQQPDFMIVAAFGLLLPQKVLDIPKFPPLNVHASLLPRYRGAAPIERAIWEGETHTGVSIMQLVQSLDAGPVYLQKSIRIGEHTADSLRKELADLGGAALIEVLEQMAAGKACATAQDESASTYAHKLEKKDGCIDWSQQAALVHAQIRAVTSKPGARLTFKMDASETVYALKILPGTVGDRINVPFGTVRVSGKGIEIACADFWYRLSSVQPEGKAMMDAKSFVNGYLRQGSLGSVLLDT